MCYNHLPFSMCSSCDDHSLLSFHCLLTMTQVNLFHLFYLSNDDIVYPATLDSILFQSLFGLPHDIFSNLCSADINSACWIY